VGKDQVISRTAGNDGLFSRDCWQIEEINLQVESCLRRSVSRQFSSVKRTSDNKIMPIITRDGIGAAFTEDGIIAAAAVKALSGCATKNDVIAAFATSISGGNNKIITSTAIKIGTFKAERPTDGGNLGINGRGAAATIAIIRGGIAAAAAIAAAAIAIIRGGIAAAAATGINRGEGGVADAGTTAAKTRGSAAAVSIGTSDKNKT
jgi:hypothetical protein